MKLFYKIIKILGVVLVAYIIINILYILGIIFIFSNMSIPHIEEKYDIQIPLGSFDAKYGGGEDYLVNDEVEISSVYYTKNVDYLIEKYNFININNDDELLDNLKEKITQHLSSENNEKVKEFLSQSFYDFYYKIIENENGKLLLIYDNKSQTIYIIENKILS